VVVHSSLLGTSRPRGALPGRTSDVEWATKEPWPRVARGRASMAMPRVAQGRAPGPLDCVAQAGRRASAGRRRAPVVPRAVGDGLAGAPGVSEEAAAAPGGGGRSNAGGKTCRQNCVQRSNGSPHNISSIKKLKLHGRPGTIALSERKGSFIEDDMPRNNDSVGREVKAAVSFMVSGVAQEDA